MAKPVVITRPKAQALDLAHKVSALGRDVVLFPLLEISPLPDQAKLQAALAGIEGFSLVAFVGSNAIDAAFAHLRNWPVGVAISVMGEGSLLALARHGVTDKNAVIFRPQHPGRADSETLLEAMDLNVLRGKRALIVRGETGRELLADALRAAGVDVVQLAAYRRSMPNFDLQLQSGLRDLLESDSIWVLTSSEALRNLLQMARSMGESAVADLQQKCLIVSHARIAESAQTSGFQNVTCAGSGDERLLAAIQSLA